MPARPHLLTLLFHDVFVGLSLRQTGGEVTVRYYCAAVIRNSILLLVWVKSVHNWELVAFTLNTVCPTQFFSVFFGGRVGGVFYFFNQLHQRGWPFFHLMWGGDMIFFTINISINRGHFDELLFKPWFTNISYYLSMWLAKTHDAYIVQKMGHCLRQHSGEP